MISTAKTKKKPPVKALPLRSKVKPGDTWDLSSLFEDDAAWEKAFTRWSKRDAGYEKFRGELKKSAENLAACIKYDLQVDRESERLGYYVMLRAAEDQANSHYQGMQGRFESVASRISQASSFLRPEILAIPNATMEEFLAARVMKPYRLLVERLLRYKKYTLSRKEEKLLAMQSEMAGAVGKTFRQLINSDLKFGTIKNEKGEILELGNANFINLLHSPKRSVRKAAFHQYYDQIEGHENTLAAMLAGSIQKDIYYARARGYDSALTASLYSDNVPQTVYDNLITTVRKHLPALHRYYDLRRRKMKLRDIHHYDTYVPILSSIEKRYTWRQATKAIVSSLEPLGSEYCEVLERGLSGRWCDRYPNRGKSMGAFSAGSFDGDPYILMNYEPDVLNHVFTLAHEAGHSMHSYYSSAAQPYAYYNYAIFVAEVASTFNEELLGHYLLERAGDDQERAYLVNRAIDDCRSTIIRQTMFAEFEKITHQMAEAGEPLTVESLKAVYRQLLQDYFGPDFVLDDQLDLECFRIPHFYRAFYVYKYATGMSAAIALSQRVLEGGEKDRERYLNFLRSGCSKYPLELLRDAGVDMEQPEPVDTALTYFTGLVDKLDELL